MALVASRRAVRFGERLMRLRSSTSHKPAASHAEEGRESKPEPWMQRELESYFKARGRLAEMVGGDPDTFSESDIADALNYLLPTRLTAREARPSLKHPVKVFPERKEAAFDADGRPLDAGFYTGAPAFHTTLYTIYLHRKSLRSVVGESPSSPSHGHWIKREVMSNILAEELTETQYKEIIKRLSELAALPGARINEATQKLLLSFQSKASGRSIADAIKRVEQEGHVQTMGRRKTSTAVARLGRGSGAVTINKRPFLEYFDRAEDRQQVLYPLLVTKSLDEYDINVSVHGGGPTGQAGAIRLAVSKALVAMGKEGLEEGGLLNRDPRSVERKKPGQKKARKKFAWVKR